MNDQRYKQIHRKFIYEKDIARKIVLLNEMIHELEILKKEYSKRV